MHRILIWIIGVVLALLFFFRRRRQPIATRQPGAKAQETVPQAASAPAPPAAPAPNGTAPLVPDDLTVIEGIGPKTASALVGAGVDTFAKLAALSPDEIEQIVKQAGVRLIGKAKTWPRQAALAAQGDFDGLRRYQDDLRAGRAREA